MSTFTQLHYHIVFSTKNRVPSIRPDWQSRLWDYMAGIVKNLKGYPEEIRGVEDHVHCLVSIHQSIAVSDFVRELKVGSSKWVHEELQCNDLWWQEGYAAFTVSHSNRDAVKAYILNQGEHHRKMTFEQELVALLNKHEVEYDPQYLL